ncbi:MAG: hypothetical protein HETSPECPRED_008882 [Heterodermia speciosa]|uniref:Glutaminase n=1 Tax=Heterodermia speciosa TaxID=116794 RepID=A0A8H3I6I9_9LECA|nr:MAG: hypothetical protein HETSPECPRED_008882 [Heterodermia speciosa]
MASVPETGKVYPLLGRPQDSLALGGPHNGYSVAFATYLGATYDASTTNLSYLIPQPPTSDKVAGPLEIVISFLSPITPTSTLRQSIPASYLNVQVKGESNVDIYLDLNGQWASGDRGSEIVWGLGTWELGSSGKGLKTWRITKETEALFSEVRDQAEWGTLHFTAPSDVRHEAGTSAILRQRFARTGTLQNEIDEDFRGIMEEEPVFAFAKSFVLNSTKPSSKVGSDSVLFTIAHTQDPVVQFASARGLTYMRPLWASWFPSVGKLLSFHYMDYQNAAKLAGEYAARIVEDAQKSGSEDYADIVSLAARQIIGATSFSGIPDDPILFIKEISSNGNFQTIDIMFPASPFFLYTNPRWLAYMLEPTIEHTLSGQYPNKYAMHDLGAHFPNATGHPDGNDEKMPVEECGNILMMGLALVQSLTYDDETSAGSPWSSLGGGDFDPNPSSSAFPLNQLDTRDDIIGLDDSWGGSTKGAKQARKWVERSYRLWRQWTGYLVEYALEPSHQLSTDDFAGPLRLQTNLALKGIVGIRAMADIAKVMGNEADVKYFKNISDVYVSKWEELGMSRDGSHAKLAYYWYGSWTTLYNLFNDALLCFHLDGTSLSPSRSSTSAEPKALSLDYDGQEQQPLDPDKKHNDHHHSDKSKNNSTGFVPRRIYERQSDWYHAVRQRYGLPLDSRHLYTKTDWEFFATAVASTRVRNEIWESYALWVNETSTDRPLTDLHDTEGDGGFLGAYFMARPVIGGHFAFLALGRACGGKAVEGLAFLDKDDGKGKVHFEVKAKDGQDEL